MRPRTVTRYGQACSGGQRVTTLWWSPRRRNRTSTIMREAAATLGPFLVPSKCRSMARLSRLWPYETLGAPQCGTKNTRGFRPNLQSTRTSRGGTRIRTRASRRRVASFSWATVTSSGAMMRSSSAIPPRVKTEHRAAPSGSHASTSLGLNLVTKSSSRSRFARILTLPRKYSASTSGSWATVWER